MFSGERRDGSLGKVGLLCVTALVNRLAGNRIREIIEVMFGSVSNLK